MNIPILSAIVLVISQTPVSAFAATAEDTRSQAFGCSQLRIDEEGSIHTDACAIPLSPWSSSEAKKSAIENANNGDFIAMEAAIPDTLSLSDYALKLRKYADSGLQKAAQGMADVFPVTLRAQVIAGVQTDVVAPQAGVSANNRHRVLINLHGGGMIAGARYEGQLMSIPVASVGKIEVVTIYYRMAPEYKFPAASEDVAKVYAELLKHHKADTIGIYGCSAGGILTSQTVAWFQAHNLPRPGAIAILCAGIGYTSDGDSVYQPATPSVFRLPRFRKSMNLYGSDASEQDPLFNPLSSRVADPHQTALRREAAPMVPPLGKKQWIFQGRNMWVSVHDSCRLSLGGAYGTTRSGCSALIHARTG